ncbi:hypothetical protein FMUND_3059 [Fusarium mundagurra]|uniref:Uncharacterized protein n=1 Tax=Fusarium mundagurra TaxID=1567541 RepID=A0A8H6DP04_9HYPO|nr:hypothetical protein FMUND_3059 [Fusarium mundagurra]
MTSASLSRPIVTEKDPNVLSSQNPKAASAIESLPTDFDKELEDASQKFRDAAEAAKKAKKAEAARVKQEKSIPQKSESDSDSESSSESESDGGDDVEIHPLEAWERYNSKWKAIDKSGLEEGLPVVYQVPWPVTSGKQWHVSKEEVVRFFNNIADDRPYSCMNACAGALGMPRIRLAEFSIKAFGKGT